MSDFRKRSSGDSNGTLTPTYNNNNNNNGLASNSNSFLNLTNSALSGVFGSQVSLAELTGDVSNAPSRRPSTGDLQAQAGGTGTGDGDRASKAGAGGGGRPISAVSLATSIATLFGFGVAYGQLSRHLHDNHQVTSYTLDIDQTGAFSLLWGSQGIVLGFLFPLFDWMYPEKNRKWSRGKGGADWSSIIRSIAAFMGVAYGIRKLSWTSTLQAAFYWGMVNPCLWFILDATRNGFILSCLTAIVGTTVFAIIFPNHLPTPGLSEEYVSVTVWVASVFFCCSICFGNTGRRLLSFPHNSTLDYDDEK